MTGQAIAVPVAAVLDGGTHETRCERCLTALHVELPSLADVLAAVRAPLLPTEFPPLTGRERQVAVVLLAVDGAWVDSRALQKATLGPGYHPHVLLVVMARLRAKLRRSGVAWRVDSHPIRPPGGWRLVPASVPMERSVALTGHGRVVPCPLCEGPMTARAQRCWNCLQSGGDPRLQKSRLAA